MPESIWTSPAVVAALVTIILTGGVSILRYIFDIQLITKGEVNEQIEDADRKLEEQIDEIIYKLEEHSNQLSEIEKLIMGGEYQISDGMLELVEMNEEEIEDHESRIEGVERIQLKIRRRQQEHTGGEPVARKEDVDPPPDFDTDLHNSEDK